MLVKIRNFSNCNKETKIKISKTAKIAKLKDEIKKILAIEPHLQKLYFSGKHLELENTLYDYRIKSHNVIQMMVKSEAQNDGYTLKNLTVRLIDIIKYKNGTYRNQKVECKNPDNTMNDAESDYYAIGDPIDCLDSRYGAWFEATIKKICIMDNKLMYAVEWDLVENRQLFYANEESIRPRANKVIAAKSLKVGDKVMINHNLDRPSDIGFWYDFEIDKISSTTHTCNLTGTLYIGPDHEPLYNHKVVLKQKIYAIEKSELLENRDPNDRTSRNYIRRPIAPECFTCYDKLDVICKECACAICGGKNNPHLILLCDECEDEYHITCLTPPLSEIPKDDWYCSKCKNDVNEIIKEGQLVKKRPLNDHKDKCSKTAKNKKRKEKCSNTFKDKKRPDECSNSIKYKKSSEKCFKTMRYRKSTEKCSKIMKYKKSTEKNSKTVKYQKSIPTVALNHVGRIPGVEVGTHWINRVELFKARVHAATISGIHGHQNHCAYSLILSGNYNDIDYGNEFIYTGAGGHGQKGSLKEPIADQTLTRANKALALNCKATFNDEVGATATNWRAGIPVRVIRSHKLSGFSQYAPTEGNRYDGLYKVVKYYPEIDQSGFRIWRYLLRRDDSAPPPWTTEGTTLSANLDLTMNDETKLSQTRNHEDYKINNRSDTDNMRMTNENKEDEELKKRNEKDEELKKRNERDEELKKRNEKDEELKKRNEKDEELKKGHETDKKLKKRNKQGKELKKQDKKDRELKKRNKKSRELKKEKRNPYRLKSIIKKSIETDIANSKLWEQCKSYLPKGKKKFLKQVLLSFQCVCCHELVTEPVTTPCAHNICHSCFKKSFSAGLKSCPTCRCYLKISNISVNEKLNRILSLLFRKYSKAKN